MAKRGGKLIFEPDYRRTGYREIKDLSKAIFNLAWLVSIAGLLLIFSLATKFPGQPSIWLWLIALVLAGVWLIFCMWIARASVDRILRSRTQKANALVPEPPIVKPIFEIATLRKDDPYALSASEFEYQVARVFQSLYKINGNPVRAEVVGGAGDQGIDVKLWDATGMLVGIVQAKRYKPSMTLDPTHLRALDSVRRRLGVRAAYLVTTARFGAATIKEAEEMNIKLIDGDRFKDHLARLN